MKPYIYSILFFLSIQISVAQTKEVILKKSYKVDENTIFELDLDNVAIVFEESFDDKIHFNYYMEFINYSDRKIKDLLGEVNVKVDRNNNNLKLGVKNSMLIGVNRKTLFSMDSLKSAIKESMIFYRNRKFLYKSKDSLLKQIRTSVGNDLQDYLFKNKKKYENEEFIKNQKKIKKTFIIKLPNYIRMNFKVLHSDITFNYDIKERVIFNSFRTRLKFKKLISRENKFQLINGFLYTEEIAGGFYKLKGVHPFRVGSISNSIIDLETSKMEVGEIKKNTSIKDFSSKVLFYNFNEDFKNFSFEGDYSKIYLYKVKKANYTMDVFGYNTVLKMDNNTTTFGDSKDKKLTKILQKKQKEHIKPSGNVAIELKNGIINLID
ncbi:hypothetical protein [Polaribacter porphyrae]|uniref:Uncharacterized protein n=1 Tax=Polaribacter porphyrae TaxID=1137780 RepID=A0A2S7WRB3_9FLAO|nr:hypothetical protein [Polaribacter porphyrae]PQJ79831.1 hypothetical protein BTO18_11880 [Polaribacter porphyrae]